MRYLLAAVLSYYLRFLSAVERVSGALALAMVPVEFIQILRGLVYFVIC